MKIRKAVIPVAGKGTRFLPATKEIPKEMIPILDLPMVHYVVAEAVEAGIEQIVFVTATGKESIENYFDRNTGLESFLKANKKEELYLKMVEIGSMIDIVTIRQKEQLGLGHAILCAKDIIGDENFAVILGDDLVRSQVPVTKQLIDISAAHNHAAVIGVMEVPQEDTSKYGIVDGQFVANSDVTLLMQSMIEKPLPQNAPTNLATPGRYILTPKIFECLEKIPRGVGGEYQLTDAINMLAKSDPVLAHIFEGERFDTGQLSGYLRAVVEFALMDQRTHTLMSEIIRDVTSKYNLNNNK